VSSSKYRKSATKDVRPFFDVAKLEECLSDAQLRLFEGQDFTSETAFTIEEQDVQRLSVAVRPNITEAILASGAIPRAKLTLAVTAVNPFLKKTILVQRVSLEKDIPGDITVGSEVLEQLGGGSHMTVEVALCLAAGVKKEPGKPFMQGHWLSKKAFDLRPPKPTEDFDVEATDDATWKALGFPAKTLYYVEYYSGFNEPANKTNPIAKVRIHSDVHKKMASENLAKLARPVMAFLAAEIPCQLVAASLSEWKDAGSPEPRSPLDAFLKRLKRLDPGCTLADLRRMAEAPGMPRLRALLHADQESVRKVVEV
jgi:hypothetical protein